MTNDRIKCAVRNLRYDSTLNTMVRVWIHNTAELRWDSSISAPAQINMESREVSINPEMLGGMVEQVLTENPGKFCPPLRKSVEELLVELTSKYLLLHEIGHDLYSPSAEAMARALQNSTTPQQLLAFCSNIVEDSFIQVEFQKEYPGSDYREAFRFGQLYYQGDLTGYDKAINDPVTLMMGDPVYQMLYYFILRAYNELAPKVIRLFDSKLLPWQEDTLAMFDQAQHTVDTDTRLKTTIKFAELAYRDLKQAAQDNKIPQPQGGGGSGQGFGLQQEGQGGGGQQQDQTQNGQAANGQQQDDPNAQSGKDQPQGQGQDQGQNQSPAGAGNQQKPQQGKQPQGQQEPKTLEQQINDAAKELNKKLGESGKSRPGRTEQAQKDLRKRAAGKGAAIGAQAMGIRRTELGDNSQFLKEDAYRLYEECSTWWAKIFNESDYTLHGLDEGDVDPALIEQWWTEKNHQIFCRDVQVHQGKNIQVIFILDHSGSMGGGSWGRFGTCARVLTAMCHAFDDAHIRSTIYDFGNDVCLLKTANEQPELCGAESNVLAALLGSRTGGGTDPSKAFEALCDDPAFMEDDEKIVFFLTDGEMGSGGIEATVQHCIQTLTERGHWLFISIGLDFSPSEVKTLEAFTKPGIVKAYTSSEVSSKLGEDIFNLITEQFIQV